MELKIIGVGMADYFSECVQKESGDAIFSLGELVRLDVSLKRLVFYVPIPGYGDVNNLLKGVAADLGGQIKHFAGSCIIKFNSWNDMFVYVNCLRDFLAVLMGNTGSKIKIKTDYFEKNAHIENINISFEGGSQPAVKIDFNFVVGNVEGGV